LTGNEKLRRAPFGLFLIPVFWLLFSSCESTQQKSERLAREGKGANLRARGLVVTRRNKDVEVLATSTLQDSNGTAAVVALRNTSRRPLADVPVAIDVRGAGGKSLYRNDSAGIEPTLTKVPLLRPGESFLWVNDQVSAAARPRSVKAKVGEAAAPAPSRLPRIDVTRPRIERDPASGLEAVGFVANRSRIDQRKLVVFAVARRGRKLVAAGRAQISRLKPRKRAHYHVFFIGDPSRARITVAVPPTVLR
jgi:hypothetical protein